MVEANVSESESHVYLPEGVDALLLDAPERVRTAAFQIAERITARHKSGGANLSAQRLQADYGQTGAREGERRHVSDIATRRLRQAEVIAVRDAAVIGYRTRRYVLTKEYADRPTKRVGYTPAMPAKRRSRKPADPWTESESDGDDAGRCDVEVPPALRVPAWASTCLAACSVDVPGVIEYACRQHGVSEGQARELAARLDMNGAVAAIKAATPGDDSAKERAAKGPSDTLANLFKWRVDGREPRVHRDPFGRRLHTPITNLNAAYRGFLGFGALTPAGSQALVKIDAKNAQYLFAAHLVAADVSGPDVDQFVADTSAGVFYERTFAAAHGGREPSRTALVDYRQTCGEYDAGEDRWIERVHVVQVTERERWKKKCQGGWLFADADTGAQENSDAAAAARALYPTVHGWIVNRKLAWKPGEDGRLQPGGTSDLPRALQRVESSIFINELIPALEAARIPVFTIHDAVIVPDVCADETLTILRGLYAARGMRAEFDIERIERPQLQAHTDSADL